MTRTSSRRAALAAVLGVGLALGCSRAKAPEGPVERAELGVFFGGQVQKRQEIPFTLDRTRQTQGFRITFREPLREPLEVRWEIDRPTTRGRGRAVELGDAQARVGQRILDQELVFEPGDALGTWNVRVFVAGRAVIDRPVLIYDAAARRRARAAAGTETQARTRR
jgi:hypothetical protein